MLFAGGAANALAQADNGPPPEEAPTEGAAGRGVRILPPEPPAPKPVAQEPQAPQQQAVHAIPPAPVAAPGRKVPVAAAPVAAAPVSAPVLKACDRPVAKPTLRFTDPARFDGALKGKLRRGRPVVVDLDTPYPADNEAPLPLGAWLNEVKQSGGTVSVAPYCQKGRGFGGFFAKLFGGGPAEPYKAARRYDAVLHVDAVDQVVTQVEFAPRKATK
ncbi:hypothetical protein [Sphingobium psychrophilum]|uniref:hypothetical protein n=1 Tax=Sphingobium psychrophilum TaxID=2728834 RepID=UPI0019CF4F4F|nr:hypothetical protein [Sphingobium psychrophilum]